MIAGANYIIMHLTSLIEIIYNKYLNFLLLHANLD